MELNINTGNITLDIVRDGELVGKFKFNPNDIGTAEKAIHASENAREMEAVFKERFEKAITAEERIPILREFVRINCEKVDDIFGAGSSMLLFGETESFEMFESFFEGITPYFQKASEARKAKYTDKYKGSD